MFNRMKSINSRKLRVSRLFQITLQLVCRTGLHLLVLTSNSHGIFHECSGTMCVYVRMYLCMYAYTYVRMYDTDFNYRG
jgi:hypothetical protein